MDTLNNVIVTLYTSCVMYCDFCIVMCFTHAQYANIHSMHAQCAWGIVCMINPCPEESSGIASDRPR